MKKQMLSRWSFAAGLVLAATFAGSAFAAGPKNRMPQGGGVIYPAWTGEYFANPDLQGEPDWTRSDVRVRFDWEDWRPVLGVRAESVREFPNDHFSARWTGKIISRYDEDYTFKLESDEQARLKIKPESESEWTTLIDAWDPHERRVDEATMHLTPGTKYDVVIEYADQTGDAVCTLRWESPSTPEEVVDYVSGNSVHFMHPHVLADLSSFSGKGKYTAAKGGIEVDEDGWPTEDFSYSMMNGYTHHAGRVLLSFRGQAEVHMPGTFIVDGERFEGTLPKGKGYDPETNLTRAQVEIPPGPDDETTTSAVEMRETQRTPDSPVGSGVTDLYVMASRQVNGNEPHEPGEIIHQEARDAFLPVFSFRVQRTGLNSVAKWDERTVPTYSKIMGQHWRADMAYEKLILAANETGRDLHLNYSDSADDEFMRKLALLMKYGSDGKEPYTKPTKNPEWPPLNPNLRLYLEHGNEMGWSGIQPREWSKRYDSEIFRNDDNPIWQVLNFDGAVQNDRHFGLMRYHAYRTVKISDHMRDVFGDDAMGETVRVMLFGQYERWFQNGLMQFIDDYYNNPEYVDNPRPVSDFLWGTGPAVYYGTTNNFMTSDEARLQGGNFEDYQLQPGQAEMRPTGGAWQFAGNAGVVNNQGERHLAFDPNSLQGDPSHAIDGTAAVGYQVTVGDEDLYVYQVGRQVHEGEKGRSYVLITDLEGNTPIQSKHGDAELNQGKPGEVLFSPLEHCGWATSDSSRVGVWRLEAGKSYLVLANIRGGATVPGPDTRLDAGPGLTIDGGVLLDGEFLGRGGVDVDNLQLVSGKGTGFPLPTFRYAFPIQAAPGIKVAPSDPLVDPTWPEGGKGKSFVPEYHRSGENFAFIAGKGRISQTFEVDEDSEYALVFTGNSSLTDPESRDGELPFDISIDGERVWAGQRMGLSRKPKGGLFQWGTHYLPLEAGEHTLTIEADGDDPSKIAYFYAMHVGDIMDYAGGEDASNFLGAGAATGQTDGRFALISQLTTAEAQLWGLVPYAYEGGTNAGGDWGGGNLFYANQFKWDHPVSKVADNQWAHFWHNYGGANAFYYYPGFVYSHIHKAEEYMPWAAAIDRAHTWVLDPEGPTAAPVTFTPDQKHFQSVRASTWQGWYHAFMDDNRFADVTDALDQEGMWKGFVFRAPETGEYTVAAETSGDGKLELIVNDSQAVVENAAGGTTSTKVYLNEGVHAVKVKNAGGKFDLEKVRVE
ncbi:MAG: PA14 domain-containing protein [Phycisphaeraceae bacterium]